MNKPAPLEPSDREELLFHAAAQLRDPAKRALYLDWACEGSPELRARIEKLLANDSGDNFFAQPLASPADLNRLPPETLSAAVQEQGVGERIGRYKLLQKIGEGGCGIVYMAEQEEPVRRRVALKIIRLGMDTQSVVARFEAERQALALMDHPNIAKILDGGVTETGRPYFVMDLVQGLPIIQFCDEAQLPTKERLALFMEVCSAIQHAHQKGIIHRDIKPSNILVTLHGEKPVPKVIDFGIAKATQQRLTDKTLFTQFQHFIGTPAYMSPEQATLSGLDIDTRSDIYSLGVLLYELLTGKTPFDPKELLQAGVDEMCRTIREKEPTRPSMRLSTLGQDELTTTAQRRALPAPKLISLLRGDLDWIVMKCLEKDRARRYETANGLARDIERHMNNEPVVASPPSTVYRFQKLVRRNRVFFAATLAVASMLVLGLGLSTWLFLRERAGRREQARLRQQAEREATKSQQIAQLLKGVLAGADPVVALGRDTTILREILDQTAKRIGTELTNQPEAQIDLRLTLADTYESLGLYTNTEVMAGDALRLARHHFGNGHTTVAQALNWLGVAEWHLGKYEHAEASHRKALAIRENLFGKTNLDVAVSLQNLASVLQARRRFLEAENLLRRSLEIRQSLTKGEDNSGVATALNNLASCLMYQQKFAEAEDLFRQSLNMRRKFLGDEHLYVAQSLHNLGCVLALEGKSSQAEGAYRQALAIKRKVLGNEHPDVAKTLSQLSDVLDSDTRTAEVEDLLHQALAIERKALGAQNPQVMSVTFRRLAELLMDRGRLADLDAFLQENATTNSADFLRVRGDCLARRGHFSEAAEDFQHAIELDPDNHECWGLLGYALAATARAEDYRALCHQSIERFGNTGQILIAMWITTTCLLLPSSDVDPAALSRLSGVALGVSTNHWALAWCQLNAGLLAYRQKDFAAAIEQTQRVLAGASDNYERGALSHDSRGDVAAYMILGMANYRLNQTNEAYTALSKGADIWNRKLAKLESSDIGLYWERWVLARCLFEEATALTRTSRATVGPQADQEIENTHAPQR